MQKQQKKIDNGEDRTHATFVMRKLFLDNPKKDRNILSPTP